MSLVELNCPHCQNRLNFDVEDTTQSGVPKRPIIVSLLAVGGFILLWAIIFTLIASSRGRQLRDAKQNITKIENEAKAQLGDAKQNITKMEHEAEKMLVEAKKLKKDAEVQLNDAKRQADKILAGAKKVKEDAEGIILRDQDQLHQIFGELHPYKSGLNDVNQRYVASFSISGRIAKITLTNSSSLSVKPRISVRFIDRFGFITDIVSVTWLIDEIQPGETRIEEKDVKLNFGSPVYYQVIFNDQ